MLECQEIEGLTKIMLPNLCKPKNITYFEMNSNDEKHFENSLFIFVEIMFIQNQIYSFIAFFE